MPAVGLGAGAIEYRANSTMNVESLIGEVPKLNIETAVSRRWIIRPSQSEDLGGHLFEEWKTCRLVNRGTGSDEHHKSMLL
jgi:hypothetical protein